jgi:hypothetical protein
MQFISNVNELLTLDDVKGQVFIGGDAVFVSLEVDSPAFKGMIRQDVRPSSFRLLGEAGGLHVGIPEALAEAMDGFSKKAKFNLLLDLYLRFMQRLKGDYLFIGGVENDRDTNLEFYLVKQGRMIRVMDKRLPRINASDFSAQFMLALHDALEGQDEDLKVYWSYPLELPEKISSTYDLIPVTEGQLNPNKSGLKPVLTTTERVSPLSYFTAPLIGVVLGGVIAAGLVFFQYSSYTKLQATYRAEVAPVEEVYSQGGAMLEILTKRQRMLDEPSKQAELVRRWKEIAVATKGTGGEITRLSVYDDALRAGLGGRVAKFEIDLRVPKQNDIPLRIFAKQILTQIAESSGYEVWLRPTEARVEDGVMIVEIEGVWPDVN